MEKTKKLTKKQIEELADKRIDFYIMVVKSFIVICTIGAVTCAYLYWRTR